MTWQVEYSPTILGLVPFNEAFMVKWCVVPARPSSIAELDKACPQDVFCLRETRMVSAYRRISLFNHAIEVPNVPLRVNVDVHMVPDDTNQLMHIRIWRKGTMVHSLSLPLEGFRVHF
jgi:hypothetical protein